jgi:hypothetical protein
VCPDVAELALDQEPAQVPARVAGERYGSGKAHHFGSPILQIGFEVGRKALQQFRGALVTIAA